MNYPKIKSLNNGILQKIKRLKPEISKHKKDKEQIMKKY